MKATFHPRFGEIGVSGSADDYGRLAAMVRQGAGTLAADSVDAETGSQLALTLIRVSTVPDEAVLIRADEAERALIITGNLRYLAVFADNIASLAQDQHGGHRHIEYFDGHAYLAEGSGALILNAPRGGMPQD
ncbi:MAG: Imm32 family immunity protein [Trebonia sp.]